MRRDRFDRMSVSIGAPARVPAGSHARFVALLLLMLFPLLAPRSDAADGRQRIAAIRHQLETGSIDPARDLAPLLEDLARERDDDERHVLISAIDDFGAHDGASPRAVKAFLRGNAPPVLLAIARGPASLGRRSEALICLRSLNADARWLDEAIALTEADRSADADALRSDGELLAAWKRSHPQPDDEPSVADPSLESAALQLLRSRHAQVSADSLGQAAARGDLAVAEALLDAGIDPNARLSAGVPLHYAASGQCDAVGDGLPRRLAMIDLLVKRGADPNRTDSNGTPVLAGAVDSCPLPIIVKLVEAGAKVDWRNSRGYSALQGALIAGRWDVAELLVARGARITRAQADSLFFEAPTDPRVRALLARAITR